MSAIKTLIISDKFILRVHSEQQQKKSLASCKFDFGINALHFKGFWWEWGGGGDRGAASGTSALESLKNIFELYLNGFIIFKMFH